MRKKIASSIGRPIGEPVERAIGTSIWAPPLGGGGAPVDDFGIEMEDDSGVIALEDDSGIILTEDGP